MLSCNFESAYFFSCFSLSLAVPTKYAKSKNASSFQTKGKQFSISKLRDKQTNKQYYCCILLKLSLSLGENTGGSVKLSEKIK